MSLLHPRHLVHLRVPTVALRVALVVVVHVLRLVGPGGRLVVVVALVTRAGVRRRASRVRVRVRHLTRDGRVVIHCRVVVEVRNPRRDHRRDRGLLRARVRVVVAGRPGAAVPEPRRRRH